MSSGDSCAWARDDAEATVAQDAGVWVASQPWIGDTGAAAVAVASTNPMTAEVVAAAEQTIDELPAFTGAQAGPFAVQLNATLGAVQQVLP